MMFLFGFVTGVLAGTAGWLVYILTTIDIDEALKRQHWEESAWDQMDSRTPGPTGRGPISPES